MSKLMDKLYLSSVELKLMIVSKMGLTLMYRVYYGSLDWLKLALTYQLLTEMFLELMRRRLMSIQNWILLCQKLMYQMLMLG